MAAQRRSLETALKDVDARLRGKPGSLELKFERARLLDKLGRLDEARLAYVAVLQRDPTHFGALNDLGMLLYRAGLREEALTCFNAAVEKHPRNPLGHANLGYMLLRGGDSAKAREHYEIAAGLDPKNVETQRGLALALAAVGEAELAQRHAQAGFAVQPVVQLPYRGEGRPVRVLLAVTAGAGNVATDRFLDDRIFATAKIVAEYAGPETVLPAHDVIFNAVGDADVAAASLQRVAAIVERSGAPVINAPAAVLETGRAANARRLESIPGVVVPRIAALARTSFAAGTARDELTARGFVYPILLRSPGYHTGAHFEMVEHPGELEAVAAELPGEELLALEFFDVRAADGSVRKYRVMFVGGAAYPLHLAISANWKVHYFSADMAENADHRREDQAFLADMAATLGPRVVEALESIRAALALDYGGVDFALDRAGNAVVFEANATMTVPPPDPDERWAYRRAPIERVEGAVRSMLVAAANRNR